MRKLFAFVAGILFGFLIDLVPHVTEVTMNINLCRESCPSWFRGTSLIMYLAIPIYWGGFAILAFGHPNGNVSNKNKIIALLVSALLIVAITWMAYAYQAQII
jgi:hypothetical protein